MFTINLVDLKPLEAIEGLDKSGERYYKVDDDLFPSVTTVLGWNKGDALDGWRSRVGNEQADLVSGQATRRGTKLHGLVEKLLRGEEIDEKRLDPITRNLFDPVAEFLKKELSEIWAIEAPVYSKRLKVAGRVDLIGILKGCPTIIDFKTANKKKDRSWIEDYFLQCSAYAFCLEELTQKPVNKFSVCIANEEFFKLDVFEGNCSDHIVEFARIRKRFSEAH